MKKKYVMGKRPWISNVMLACVGWGLAACSGGAESRNENLSTGNFESGRIFAAVSGGTCAQSSIFGIGQPAVTTYSEASSVELGIKFRVKAASRIAGLRFYKAAGASGTHLGRLWNSSGQQLASVTFSGESPSGWQTAMFAKPIALAADTTYVASYLAADGRYVSANGALSSRVTSSDGSVYALADMEAGGNGVYRYGSTGGFPNASYRASNYFVDVIVQDASAPQAVAGLAQREVSSNSVTIDWMRSPESDVASYNVLRNGVIVGSVAADQSSFVDSGLAASTAYTYQILTSDACGNLSPLSAPLNVVTASSPSPTPAPVKTWVNSSFVPQTGSFAVQFDAVPSLGAESGEDALVGLSASAASSYSDLAAIVRFHVNGIDVRNGSTYSSLVKLSYVAGAKYRINMNIDLATRRYTVRVTPPGQSSVLLAQDYAFRSEQALVSSLANLARYSDVGGVLVSDFSIVSSGPAPTPSPTPAPTATPRPSPSPTPLPAPSTGAYPSASNTGVPAGVVLKPSGSITVNTAGTVIDALDIKGVVYINANNVTIKRSKITVGGYVQVRIKSGLTGVTIEDCEINGVGTGNDGSLGIQGPGTFLRNNIYNVENAITPESGSLIQDNYIHSLRASGSPHYDGIQIDGGQSNVVIRHNTVINPWGQTAAIMIDNYFGPINNVLVENNRLVGGGYTVYSDGQFTGGAINGVQFKNNRLGKGSYGYKSINKYPVVWTGNVDDVSGAPIP